MVKDVNYVTENKLCLACNSENNSIILDLGDQPLANAYKNSANDAEDKYPLKLKLCKECYHLQISHTVDPEIVYKNYLYATGTNQTIKDFCRWFAEYCLEEYSNVSSVLDIGCNDGTQLDYFKELGVPNTYGIDPADTMYARSSINHNIICDFFGPKAIDELKKVSYDIIIAQNVFAHNPNPYEFISSCAELMGDNTVLFIQTSQADMILHNEFDTIYHEHINFFNANSMNRLAKNAKLNLIDVFKTPIHGNSYIFVLSKTISRKNRIKNIISLEEKSGLLNTNTYVKWKENINKNVSELTSTLNLYRQQGYKLVGYGAAAKGTVLLNFAGITLDVIIDDNPLKHGKFMPGVGIPITSIDHLETFSKDDNILFLPLAWNFFSEIQSKILTARSNTNDVFVKYFPEVKVFVPL